MMAGGGLCGCGHPSATGTRRRTDICRRASPTREASEEARRLPYPDAENAIKDACAAVESAAQEASGANGNLEEQFKILTKRGAVAPQIQRVADSLFQLRSAVPGVAHGGRGVPIVGVDEAMLALQLAAALIGYLAAKRRA